MFQPSDTSPQLPLRGPIGLVADAVACAVARALGQIGAPKRNDALDFLLGILPNVPTLIQALKPAVPVDLDGPAVQQVKRELAAAEAHIAAVANESRARLIADFGAKFDAARAVDNRALASTVADGDDELQ